MIVYRLESSTTQFNEAVGQGVYMASLVYLVCSDSTNSSHPCPQAEGALENAFIRGEHVCCFESLHSLHRWFDTIDHAVECGHADRIATYVVPDEHFHQGRWQAIAHSDHMKLVETHSIDYRL